MKKLLVTLVVFCFAFFGLVLGQNCTTCHAANATWSQEMQNVDNTPFTDLAGWNLYKTTSGRVKVNTGGLIPPASCTGTTTLSCTWAIPANSAVKNDTFVITAVDTSGNESGDSNTAKYGVLPKAPTMLLVR